MSSLIKFLQDRSSPIDAVLLYGQVLKASESWSETTYPHRWKWRIARNVPIRLLDPQSGDAWAEDPDLSQEEAERNIARYQQIKRLLISGEPLWPIIVSREGLILDGYHRLAAAFDLNPKARVDVLWAAQEADAAIAPHHESAPAIPRLVYHEHPDLARIERAVSMLRAYVRGPTGRVSWPRDRAGWQAYGAEMAEAAGLPLLGGGSSRAVFSLNSAEVLKFDPWPGSPSNRHEARVWATAPEAIAAFLAPVHAVAVNGAWLVMTRTVPIRRWFRERDAVVAQCQGWGIGDCGKLTNWGMLDGRPVLIDYGNPGPARRANPDRGTPPRPATVKSRSVSGIISRSLAALKAPLSLSGKAIQSNPKRSKKAPWPRWLAKSEFPIYDYFQEYEEVQDEQTLLRLFELEKRRLPDLTVERIEFTPEKIAYLTTSDRPTSSLRQAGSGSFVYPREVDGTFRRKEPRDFLNDISFNSREQDYFDFYPEDRFNDEFWSSPPPLYHGTNALSVVMQEGLMPRYGTRGLSNRYIGAAVFATTNQEVAEGYRYGPDGGVLKIDTQAMKRDGLMPRVIQEPEVLEQELIGSISYRIGIHHDTEYSDSGIDPETIIIFSGIPAKYLRAI